MSAQRRMFLWLFVVLACRFGAVAGDWPMWRHDANRSAASPGELPARLHLAWQRELPRPRPAFPKYPRLCFDASYEPVVMGKMMFVPSMVTDSVAALDTETGAEKWRFMADGPVRFAPVAWRGKVYFVSDDGHLYCLDAGKGSMVWKVRGVPPARRGRRVLGNERLISRWPARGGPVLSDGIIYFGAGIWPFEGVTICAVNAETGKLAWSNHDSGYIKDGLIDHGTRLPGGLSPQGYLAVVGEKLIVPSGRALPGFFDRKSGKMDPYTSGWGGRVALAKGSWWACGIGEYFFQSGEMYGLAAGASSVPPTPEGEELLSLEELAERASVPLKTVQEWAAKGLLAAVERDGKRLVRLGEPATATYVSWWTKPFRGGEAHVLGTHPRLQLDPANAKELGEFRAPVLTSQAIYYSRPVNTQPKGSYRPVGSGCDGIVACGITSPKWGVTCCQGYDRGPRIFTTRTVAFNQLWRLPSKLTVHIKAGPRLYAGGPGAVAAVDIPKEGGKPSVSWTAKVEGTPSRMLAADGKLFVVTREGRLYCFGGGEAQPRTYAARKPPAAVADRWTNAASRILKQSGVTEGYCLALGVGTGRLLEELARQSDLHIVAVDSDPTRVDAARRKLDAMGLYGARVHILAGDLRSAGVPPYMASLAVSEDLKGCGFEQGKAFVRELFYVLRPYGGLACLPVPEGQHATFVGSAKEAKLAAAALKRAGDLTVLTRQGALPGAADWTHERADAANSFTSRDLLVKPPLGVLWFGGSVDRVFPTWDYTHSGHPTPLVVGGRVLIQVGNDLHAADAYTGRHLWKAALPALKHKRTGHNYVAVEDGIYVACNETCLRLDPATGSTLGQLGLPARLTKEKPEAWRDIRVCGDRLIGSTGRHLVCVDRRSGKELWTVRCTRQIIGFAVGGGRVFLADCSLPDRRGEVKKTEGRILALDARDASVLWQAAVVGESEKRIPLRLTCCGFSDLLIVTHETAKAYRGSDGALLWQEAIPGCNPCMLHRDRLITQEGEMFDPLTGSRLPARLWKGTPNRVTRGCNHAIAGEHLVAVRDGHSSFFDLATCRQTLFRGVRSGCTNSLIAANGLLNSPNFAHGCSCNYSVFTSLALVRMPAAASWDRRPRDEAGGSE